MFDKPIDVLIKERKSTRHYDDRQVSADHVETLQSLLDQLTCDDYRFVIADYSMKKGEKISTYGLIKNAKKFIYAISDKNIGSDRVKSTQFGYDFEKIILKATDLGIDTCWMGMSYNEKQVLNTLKTNDKERLIMATPIGYRKKSSIQDSLTRRIVGAHKRKNNNKIFYDRELNKELVNFREGYEHVLNMVRLAPSAGNVQPWRIVQTGDGYDFYLKPAKFYDKMKDKRVDFSYNDMGIAKLHFEIATEASGLEGQWIHKKDEISKALEYLFSWQVKKA